MSKTYTTRSLRICRRVRIGYHSHLHTLTAAKPITAWPDCSAIGAPMETFRRWRPIGFRSGTWCCNTTMCSIERENRPARQSQLATICQHDNARRNAIRAEERDIPADSLRSISINRNRENNTSLCGRGTAVNAQRPRAAPVHPEQSATVHSTFPGQKGNDVPAYPSLPTICATCKFTVNGLSSRSSRARPDRPETGARERQRFCVHERAD